MTVIQNRKVYIQLKCIKSCTHLNCKLLILLAPYHFSNTKVALITRTGCRTFPIFMLGNIAKWDPETRTLWENSLSEWDLQEPQSVEDTHTHIYRPKIPLSISYPWPSLRRLPHGSKTLNRREELFSDIVFPWTAGYRNTHCDTIISGVLVLTPLLIQNSAPSDSLGGNLEQKICKVPRCYNFCQWAISIHQPMLLQRLWSIYINAVWN